MRGMRKRTAGTSLFDCYYSNTAFKPNSSQMVGIMEQQTERKRKYLFYSEEQTTHYKGIQVSHTYLRCKNIHS